MSATRKAPSRQRAIESLDIIKRFTLEISSINCHLEEVRQIWGKTLGISGPQWMILIAISDLDKDGGVPVNVVSKLLHVDPSFVTTQSKLLEQKGLLRRASSPVDARVVQMSLTDKTRKHMASLAEQYSAIRKFVFEEFDEKELTAFTAKLVTLNNRLEKVCLKVASDFDF
ncbi:MarR family winged helix-turn-helix transcriptional regulator [Bradyrhizobium erythrophlei]|uniref:MarR family winged helix-turn-helix transcriptional regulator n=1 Tax=Bradyrhizobium erythrophlei TaxID=1437360 RepID=UPI0035ED6C07